MQHISNVVGRNANELIANISLFILIFITQKELRQQLTE